MWKVVGEGRYLLLELLVNCVQRIFHRYSFHVPCRYLETQGEMEVDLLDRWIGKELFQRFLIIYRRWGGVELPVYLSVRVPYASRMGNVRLVIRGQLGVAIDRKGVMEMKTGYSGINGHVPIQFLRLLCYLELLAFLFYESMLSADVGTLVGGAGIPDLSGCQATRYRGYGLPKSLMLYTPVALELALRWPFLSFCGGEDDRPETAESTLDRGAVSADMAETLRDIPRETIAQTASYKSQGDGL